MLTHLTIQNFTLVEHLDLDLQTGMTVITGETGAGKSIVLDALAQTLGDRADPDRIRAGSERADITASFDVTGQPTARQWLAEHDLQAEDPDECLLRRVLGRDGKSRGYINGRPATLQQLRALGDMLIDIHSQHEHQSLLQRDTHRRLLDEFGGHEPLARQVRQAWRAWHQLQERLDSLRQRTAESDAQFQLLSYQVNELEQLDIQVGEVERLESEQRSLANADDILRNSHQLQALCNDEEQGLLTALHRALQLFRDMPEKSHALQEAEQLLTSARIQVEEAQHEIDHHLDHFNADPERLFEVEQRLSALYDMARKHRIDANELPALAERLAAELSELQQGEGDIALLEEQCDAALQVCRQQATELSAKRQKTALKLAKAVNAQLKQLAMENAAFTVSLSEQKDKITAHGFEDIEFLISTNPGQPPRSLGKVASGGELSRISLAIQVITAQTSATPTLVFDEVDVGIGGATGDVVGNLLRQLGEKGQVICVTHLAQVASKGHHHLQVVKTANKQRAQSTLTPLTSQARIEEIARMLGGLNITEQSLAHAREILAPTSHL